VQGRDFQLSDNGLVLIFNDNAKVPKIDREPFVPPNSPASYGHREGNDREWLLYRFGVWFHRRNLEITYVRKDFQKPKADPTIALPKTMARLKARQPLRIAVSGDSISTGLDSSGKWNAFPHQPGYIDLIAAQLQVTYGSEIALDNRAVAGWSVDTGVNDVQKLLEKKPNLVIVAYGMNDVGRRDPKWFHERTKQIIDKIKAADPEIEIVLVAPMLGHRQWVHTPRDQFAAYRDRLKSLTQAGVALADATAVWETMLQHKHDFDLTGNGLNHPNDFGHRLYAQCALKAITNRE
jgi:lysophospholipase L1-like esterase